MPDVPFVDVGLEWFVDILNKLIEWFEDQLITGLESLPTGFLSTPLPSGSGTGVVFSPPGSGPWQGIYEATVGGESMLLGFLILFLSVQAHHFIRIFDFGTAYRERRTSRQAWTGAIIIGGWYWLGVLTLYFVEGLTVALVPDVSVLASTLIDILPDALLNPMLTLLMAAVGGLAMVALQALLYVREILLYVYLWGMPIGVGVAFANVPVLSRIARGLCKQFVPLAALPLPIAVLFRGYEVLFAGSSALLPEVGFLQYFVVVALPLLALWAGWRTFTYASPLVARVIGTTAGTVATVGAIAGAGYVAGPYAAATAARFGPWAGAASAAVRRGFRSTDDEPSGPEGRPRYRRPNPTANVRGPRNP